MFNTVVGITVSGATVLWKIRLYRGCDHSRGSGWLLRIRLPSSCLQNQAQANVEGKTRPTTR